MTTTQPNDTSTEPGRIARCYKYYCRAPTTGLAAYQGQISLARDYYRASLQLAEKRRAEFRRQVGEIGELVERPLQERLDGLVNANAQARQEKKTRRAQARSKKVDTADLDAQIKSNEAVIDELRRELKSLRQARKNDPRWDTAAAWFKEQTSLDGMALRAEYGPRGRGLHFRNYLAIDRAVQDQIRRRTKDGSPFNFHCVGRWNTIVAGIGTSEKISVPDFMASGHSQIRIDPLPEGFWDLSSSRRRTVLRMQVGTQKSPAWIEVPLLLDRPMPEDGLITEVRLIRQPDRPRDRWNAIFVVLEPAPHTTLATTSPVAIDVGWRLRPQGVRVAAIHHDGKDEELVLESQIRDGKDYGIVSGFEHADGLRALIDVKHNEIRSRLQLYFAETTPPEWLLEATKTMALWHSTRHLARIVDRWASDRYDGDEPAFEAASAWSTTNTHLIDYATSARRRARNRRDDCYRKWAAQICAMRRPIVVEDIDLHEIAELDVDGDNLPQAVRRLRHRVAPGMLIQFIATAARHRGIPLLRVPAQNTSRTCPSCGGNLKVTDPTDLFRTCDGCGQIWDQDYAAARNLAAAGIASLTAVESEESGIVTAA